MTDQDYAPFNAFVYDCPADDRFVTYATVPYIQLVERLLGFPLIAAYQHEILTVYSDRELTFDQLNTVYPGLTGWALKARDEDVER